MLRILPFLTLLLATLTGISATARAQDEGPSEEAKAAFSEGLKHFNGGRSEKAAEAFRRAYRLSPSWKLWYNVGQSEMGAKRYGLALEAFERYLVEGGDEVDEVRRGKVQKEIDDIRKLVGFIDIKAPVGSLVVVDGVMRGTAPLDGSLPVAASVKHKVVVSSKGRVIGEQHVRVMGKREETVIFRDVGKLVAAADAAEEPEIEDPKTSAGRENDKVPKILGWSGVAGGIVVGGLSGIFFGLAGSSTGEFDNARHDYERAVERLEINPADQAALDSMQASWDEMDAARQNNSTRRNLGMVFVISGGALAVTGVTLLLLGFEDEEQNTTVTVSPNGLHVRF